MDLLIDLLVALVKWIIKTTAESQARARQQNPQTERFLSDASLVLKQLESRQGANRASARAGRRARQAAVIAPPVKPASTVRRLVEDAPTLEPARSASASLPVAAKAFERRSDVARALILGEVVDPPAALR